MDADGTTGGGPDAARKTGDTVFLTGEEYLALLRQQGEAASLAAYVTGVLSAGRLNRGAAELIRSACNRYLS